MHKICVYVPAEHLEQVKNAMFEAGAGKIGHYDRCCWQVKGVGQFRPLENSKPFIGDKNKIERVDEYKVEMVCDDAVVTQVVTALKAAHPYEEPAYQVWEVRG